MNDKITRARLEKFLSYYRPFKKIFTVDMFVAAVAGVAAVLFPLVSGKVTELVSGEWSAGTGKSLLIFGVILLILLALRITCTVMYSYFGHSMGAKMEGLMREELFEHYEKLGFDFHAKNSVGKLMSVMSTDLGGMTELFHHGPEDILITLIKLIGSFFILIFIDPALTVILFVSLPLLTLASLWLNPKMKRALLKSHENMADLNDSMEDTLAGIRTVKAFGNEDKELEKFRHCSRAYTDSMSRFYKLEASFYDTMGHYPQILTALAVLAGAILMNSNSNFDLPMLVTFLLYVGTLAEPVNTLFNFMRLLQEGKAGFIRFMNILETEPAVKEPENPDHVTELKGDINFENVSFRYEDSDEVLKGLDLSIKSGEQVALVGASGIGKTTVSLLMARFYDVTGGRITVDGHDIRNIPTKILRKHIGIVQQEVYIFGGTIADNIRYGKPGASEDEVIAAAKNAGIHEFIMSLPKKYDTVVGTKGITLSGGQRQRISVARLFLKDPKILILDEATSALDYESEQIVQASLERLMKGRTSLVIAHRLSTVQNSDRIFVLGDGVIAESGSHQELMAFGGEYAKLNIMK